MNGTMPRGPKSVVLGGAGYLGINLVDELVGRGQQPVCVRRRTTNVLALRKRRVPMVIGDLDDPVSLRDAFDGAELVYHVAGHYPRHSQHADESVATATRQMRNALDAAAEAGVRRMVYVSSTASVAARDDGRPADETDVFAESPGFGAYHDVKWAMEALALAEDRFDVRVACPGACVGPWDLRVGTTALLVGAAHGALPSLPAGTVNPVDTADVAVAVRRMAESDGAPRRVLLSGGNVDLHTFLGRFAARFGAPSPPPPVSAERASADADAEEQRVLGTPERPKIVREIVDLIVHGTALDTTLAEDALGMEWTPLSVSLDRFTEWAQRFRILPPQKAAHEPASSIR